MQKLLDLQANSKTKTKVKIAGRLMTLRNLGKITFGVLQDGSGRIQIVLQEKETSKNIITFFNKYVDTGDFLGIEGFIFKTERGELSVLIKKLVLLTKSILPLPEKWHGLQDKEERYRKRYLDLIITPETKETFKKREQILFHIRQFLKDKNFVYKPFYFLKKER